MSSSSASMQQAIDEYDYFLKVLLLGDFQVGKSTLCQQLTGEISSPEPTPLIDFALTIIESNDNTKTKLQIWDTSGQEKSRAIIHSYFKDTRIYMLVFALNDKKSFEHLEAWIADIKDGSSANENISIIVIGTKKDLTEDRQITAEEAQQFCQSYQSHYIETTILTEDGIQPLNAAIREAVTHQIRLGYGGFILSNLEHSDSSTTQIEPFPHPSPGLTLEDASVDISYPMPTNAEAIDGQNDVFSISFKTIFNLLLQQAWFGKTNTFSAIKVKNEHVLLSKSELQEYAGNKTNSRTAATLSIIDSNITNKLINILNGRGIDDAIDQTQIPKTLEQTHIDHMLAFLNGYRTKYQEKFSAETMKSSSSIGLWARDQTIDTTYLSGAAALTQIVKILFHAYHEKPWFKSKNRTREVLDEMNSPQLSINLSS